MKSTKAIIFVVGISLLFVLLVLGSLFAEPVVKTKHDFKIDRGLNIQSQLQQVSFWKDWLRLEDVPGLKLDYLSSGKDGNNGMVWKSSYEGKGGLKLWNHQDSLTYQLVTDNQQFIENGVFVFNQEKDSTSVCWKTKIDFSKNIKAKYLSYFSNYQNRFSSYQKVSLKELEVLLHEKIDQQN